MAEYYRETEQGCGYRVIGCGLGFYHQQISRVFQLSKKLPKIGKVFPLVVGFDENVEAVEHLLPVDISLLDYVISLDIGWLILII